MRKLLNVKFLSVLIFFSACSSQAADSGLEERLTQEIARFEDGIENKQGPELIAEADLLTGRGFTDPNLYEVVEKRTKEEYARHLASPRDKQIARNLNSLVRAYGSFGNTDSQAFIQSLVSTAKSRGVRNRAHRLHPKLGWFKKRNELMQNKAYYNDDQKLMTHRFMGLILSNDYSYRRWGSEEINRLGGSEDIVYQAMANTLREEAKNIQNDLHLDSLAWFCKILARYDSANQKELLTMITSDKNYHRKLRKYAGI